ncbi:MAG TPA: ABC transporter permease [Arenimonas sp.]|nr:ABC transporter permease [Arenimonas sp.]HOZ04559.1 ABC transporter permease [Arenimonas sp.]
MNLRRLWAIVIKELRQLRRDRVTAAMIVGIPTIQLLMFGFAINLDVRGLKAAIADQAHTSASRAVVQDMLATGVIVQKESAQTPDDLMQALKRGRISVGIVIPPDFERRLAENREAVQVLVDGSDISVQNAARQLAQMPLNGQNSLRPAQISVVSFYNPERRSAVNVVPGLVGVILTMTMILFTAVAIVRERERGNLELLITTPVSRTELMVGKVLPYIVIGLVQTTIVLLLGVLVFQVPTRGHWIDVYGATMLLIMANLSLGLLISTRAQSQFQAMQMSFFLLLPSILLSGFMFPFAGMPKTAQWIAEVLPLTHFMRLNRGIMLRGASLMDMWQEALILLVFTIVMMSLAIMRFSKRLD